MPQLSTFKMSKNFFVKILIYFLDNKFIGWILKLITMVICFIALLLPLKILIYYNKPLGFIQEYIGELKNEK